MRTLRYQRLLQWSECDPAGIIFFPHYARWMVEGLNLLLLGLEIDPNGRTAEGFHKGLPSTGFTMNFHAPAMLHELLVHEVAIIKIGTKSIGIRHRFLRDDTLLAEAEETRIWTVDDGTGMRSVPITAAVKDLLSADAPAQHRVVRSV